MKALLAVARREIGERRFVLVAAAVASVIPILVPIVRQLSGDAVPIAREMTALILAGTFGAGLAVALGVSLFTAELVSRRMGFYFSKPISAGALWAGKFLGAGFLVVAGIVIPLLPTLALGRGLPHLRDFSGGSWSAIVTAGAELLVLMLVSHACAIAIRSQSRLALFELLAGAAVVLGAWALFLRLIPVWMILLRGVADPAGRLVVYTTGVLAVVLLLASYRAIAGGRTAPRIVHRRQFQTIWSALGGTIALGFLYSTWVLSTPLAAVNILSIRAAGPSGWVWLEGIGRGAWDSILFDTRSGAFERLPAGRVKMTAVSQDGSSAAWAELSRAVNPSWIFRMVSNGPTGAMLVKLRSLDRRSAPAVETKAVLPASVYSIALSPGGTKLAAIEQQRLSVFDLKSGRLTGAFHFSGDQSISDAWFETADRIRVFERDTVEGPSWSLGSFEIDLAARSLAGTGRLTLRGGSRRMIRSASKDHLLIADLVLGVVRVVDSRTLAVRSTISLSGQFIDGAIRSDGGILLLCENDAQSWADLYSSAGATEGRILLGQRHATRLGVESSTGLFPVSLRGLAQEERTLVLIDSHSRSLRLASQDLIPLPASWLEIDPDDLPAGCEASKLFFGLVPGGSPLPASLVRFDPDTGEKRVVLGHL